MNLNTPIAPRTRGLLMLSGGIFLWVAVVGLMFLTQFAITYLGFVLIDRALALLQLPTLSQLIQKYKSTLN